MSSDTKKKDGCLFWLLVAGTIIVTNVMTYVETSGNVRSAYSAESSGISEPMTPRVIDPTLKDFAVVNAHEHLYRVSDLPKYFQAAQNTGIVRTLFVASSDYTLKGKGHSPGSGNEWNSEEIIRAANEYPGKIIPVCTIYPRDPDALDQLKRHVANGAQGVKLYTGHSQFHEDPLDTPALFPLYAYLEETRLPVIWHVGLDRYGPEFERVMTRYPNLVVVLPHFGQAYWNPVRDFPRLRKVMDTYPNIYTDTSLGTREILVGGLYRINEHREIFRQFCLDYSDRVLFGTDMVVTGNSEKTADWIESVLRAARDVLEKDTYYFFMAARGSKYAARYNPNPYGELHGLALDDTTLRKIYETNILALFPASTP